MTTFASFLSRRAASWSAAILGVLLLAGAPALAYPPALPHTFYGMVRDEQGNPLTPGASIILETASGVKVYGVVSSLLAPGVNYRLRVPLDAGLASVAYKPTALNPQAPFKIRIKVDNATYLPIEMSRDFAQMGQPGKSTLLNLTLGEDSNGDGIPDAWQRRINSDLSQVSPDGDADNDGLTNLQEYLAGTYAFDPASGFMLNIVRFNADAPVLAFTAVAGRTYTLLGSVDLEAWSPAQFRIAGAAAESAPRDSYFAPDVRAMEVEAAIPAGQPAPRFFKVMLE